MRKHWTYLCSWRNNCLTPSLYWGRNMAIAGQWPPHLIIKTVTLRLALAASSSILCTRPTTKPIPSLFCFISSEMWKHVKTHFHFSASFCLKCEKCKNSLSLFCKLTFSTITFTREKTWPSAGLLILNHDYGLINCEQSDSDIQDSLVYCKLFCFPLFSDNECQDRADTSLQSFVKYRLYSVPLCSKQLFRLPPCDDRT